MEMKIVASAMTMVFLGLAGVSVAAEATGKTTLDNLQAAFNSRSEERVGSGHRVVLIYGNRNHEALVFKNELDELAARAGGRLRIVYVMSDDPARPAASTSNALPCDRPRLTRFPTRPRLSGG